MVQLEKKQYHHIQELMFYINIILYYLKKYGEKSIGGAAKAIVNTFTPEDIELSETLYCLWIAE